MSDLPRPLKVFLYHAVSDRIAARDLYLRLIGDGVDAWLVKDRLLPGQDWREELHRAISEADAVVVCVSGRLDPRESREREVWTAFDQTIEQLDGQVFVVPVRLEACQEPENLAEWQSLDLFEEAGYRTLINSLRAKAEEVGATIQAKEGSLPRITTLNVKTEESISEEKPVKVTEGRVQIIRGAGILIEDPSVKEHTPGRAMLLALLGIASIIMVAWFGPSWIENSQPATVTPEKKATPTSMPRTKRPPILTPQVIPIPTLTWQGNVSHIVFLIDTTASMQGQRIRSVKSAASKFVSGLGDDYLVSVIEFDTNVELRMAATRDHTAAIDAIQSIVVEVPHNGACIRDAFHAAIEQASSDGLTNDTGAIIILLSDVALGENLGWNCGIAFDEATPVPVFSIYLGEDFVENQFVASIFGEGSVRPAMTEKKIQSTLLEVSKAAGLKLNTELVFSAPAQTMPLSMVFVPPGEFTMGDNTVHLDAFWIDKTEVTNAMYARCVQAGQCSAPRSNQSHTHESYFGNPGFDDYPVIYVSWEDARNYCSWVGGRLPTEAEWEKAARGTDGRPFPWGDRDPSTGIGLLNYFGQDTTEVGSFPEGASPYGALDMAGNVSEWVADWLSPEYYNNPPSSNPLGPDAGEYRVWRGGSWANTSTDLIRTYGRTGNLPTDASGGIGFRCARDAGP
jgi:formylglycine-generating enzyme required for sulfatase activity